MPLKMLVLTANHSTAELVGSQPLTSGGHLQSPSGNSGSDGLDRKMVPVMLINET